MGLGRDLVDAAAFTRQLAGMGGEMALRWVGSRRAEWKADDSPVTEADKAVQAALLDKISRRFPAHAVLVEEALDRPDRHHGLQAEFCWVIDPIDGTRNFARGSSTFATSVALLQNGRPVCAAIFDGRTRCIYHAMRGGGAFLSGPATQDPAAAAPLRVANAELDGATIMAISSFRGKRVPDGVRRLMDSVMFRNLGSLCLHMASVASGDFDALYSHEAKLWDIAAGCLLIEEAGGIASGPDGAALWPVDLERYDGGDIPILAAGPRMHTMLRPYVTSAE